MVIKPDNVEVSMKVHWVSFEVADGAVRDALASLGTVQEIVLDTWRLDGFVGMQSTTADAENIMTRRKLPHQISMFSGNALVVAPGKAPLCSPCKQARHVRKDCRIPMTEECRFCGHMEEDCVRTYSVATGNASEDGHEETIMDELEGDVATGEEVEDSTANTAENAKSVPPEAVSPSPATVIASSPEAAIAFSPDAATAFSPNAEEAEPVGAAEDFPSGEAVQPVVTEEAVVEPTQEKDEPLRERVETSSVEPQPME